MKKRLLALLLALAMLLALSACGGSVNGEEFADSAEISADDSGAVSDTTPEENDAPTEPEADPPAEEPTDEPAVEDSAAAEEYTELPAEDGWYYSADEVALYLWTYGYLPGNFITKNQARDLGWEGGSVERYAPGCAIGGDKFGNREGILPRADGRQYYECDINTDGKNSRGAERLVFSNDGLIYYTNDHYESFTLLYGEE